MGKAVSWILGKLAVDLFLRQTYILLNTRYSLREMKATEPKTLSMKVSQKLKTDGQ